MQKEDSFFAKEMSRKQFLGVLGLGLLTLVGYTAIVELFSGSKASNKATAGFGSGPYSGYGQSKSNNALY